MVCQLSMMLMNGHEAALMPPSQSHAKLNEEGMLGAFVTLSPPSNSAVLSAVEWRSRYLMDPSVIASRMSLQNPSSLLAFIMRWWMGSSISLISMSSNFSRSVVKITWYCCVRRLSRGSIGRESDILVRASAFIFWGPKRYTIFILNSDSIFR